MWFGIFTKEFIEFLKVIKGKEKKQLYAIRKINSIC